jgi:hypothetical protein
MYPAQSLTDGSEIWRVVADRMRAVELHTSCRANMTEAFDTKLTRGIWYHRAGTLSGMKNE